jgi:hypothetical protein
MKVSLDQQRAQRPPCSATGVRQVAQSGGKQMSSVRRAPTRKLRVKWVRQERARVAVSDELIELPYRPPPGGSTSAGGQSDR